MAITENAVIWPFWPYFSTNSRQIRFIDGHWGDAGSIKISRTCGHVKAGSGRGKRGKCVFLALQALFLNQFSPNLVHRWPLGRHWFDTNFLNLWSRNHRKWAWGTPKMQFFGPAGPPWPLAQPTQRSHFLHFINGSQLATGYRDLLGFFLFFFCLFVLV